MFEEIDNIKDEAILLIKESTNQSDLESQRIKYLGKKGHISKLYSEMKKISIEDKKKIGQKLNKLKSDLTEAINNKKEFFVNELDKKEFSNIDITLPSRKVFKGNLHPITKVWNKCVNILRRSGFSLAEGPEIETEWYCFDALNTPKDHPARNESDTFYLENGKLLRTHTSSVQIRTMEKNSPPIKIISPGSAFRRDEIDATHLSSFHQLEGLYVNDTVTLIDLKETLEHFFHEFFGPETKIRFRPHFFPFTEPSFEVDMKLKTSGKNDKWIEIAGCGMVDPEVFKAVSYSRKDSKYDYTKVSGFAFGMGIDRLSMIEYGISDLRLFIENDTRFLSQFI